MELNSKLKERLLKLVALAERGVGGEKDAAQSRLGSILAENGMTMADLDILALAKSAVIFRPKAEHFKAMPLLMHVIGRVMGLEVCAFKPHTGEGYVVEVTREQEVEIKVMYSIYVRALNDQAQALWIAFVNVNKIFPENMPVSESHQPLGDDIIRMAKGLSRINITKQIGSNHD